MTESDPHAVDPADEGRHVPTGEPLWNESHYLDFVTNDGAIAGYARIGLYPNLGVTWWTTMLVGPHRPLVASMAYDWAVPTDGLALRGDDHSVDGDVVRPLDRLHLHGSAPAQVLGRPEDVYQGVEGSPTTLGFDLTWSTDGVPYQYAVTTRYEIPCLVSGTVTVGDEVLAVSRPRPAGPLLGGARLVGLRMVLVRRPPRRRDPYPRSRHPVARGPATPRVRAAPGWTGGHGRGARCHRGAR